MEYKGFKRTKKTARGIVSFFVPNNYPLTSSDDKTAHKKIAIIIPTYKPKNTTYRLISSIAKWHPDAQIVVVDDNTPLTAHASRSIIDSIKTLTHTNKNITVTQTHDQHLKANALNVGLSYIYTLKNSPDVVMTFDDDIFISRHTIPTLVSALFADKRTGIVTSLAWVKNKNANILTRMQGLEYHGFNITKIGDNGFLHGPLVMQGMLSAFKFQAIKKVTGFRTNKLIEDYDITVRVKNAGYKTAVVPHAHAWTYAPETLGQLWRQRIRWSYGGIIVIKDFWRETQSIFQDVIGHFVFISLLALVLISLVAIRHVNTPSYLVAALFTLALVHFVVAFLFNLASLLTYKNRDRVDIAIKATIIPEFIYTNILSAILIGSYLFFVFNVISQFVISFAPKLTRGQIFVSRGFQKLGYSLTWGTRA